MNLAYNIFVWVVWFLSMYFVVLFILYLAYNRKNLFKSPLKKPQTTLPIVSIIISAYNEENNILHTLKSLEKINYPKDKLELIIVNDGSTDQTSKVVRENIRRGVVFIDNKKNKGKAACLNQGIAAARGIFVATMDADSVVEKDVLLKTIPYFQKEKIGAVTISVEVKNPKSILEKIIELEYILGLSLFLKVFSYAKCIHVTPGPFSIYRKKMLTEIGGFDPKNITEDLEIAYRIRKAGYDIDCCMNAKVKTKIPNTVKGLYKQRRRWYTGALHSLWKHKDMVMNHRWGVFGYFLAFNYALTFFGIILFIYTFYLGLKNAVNNIYYYYLTNFNFFEHFKLEEIDFLSISIFYYFGITSLIAGLIMLVYGMKVSRRKIGKRKLGAFGYIYIFFMYQLFWISSLFHAIFGKKVKWR